MSLAITIDSTDLDEVTDALVDALGGGEASPVRQALRRAVKKTATWVQTRLMRHLPEETGIPRKLLAASKRIRVKFRDEEALVWIGTDPVDARLFGDVRWTRRMKGAKAGRRLFTGAFAWGPNPERPLIFRRSGKDRLPIEKETVPFDASVKKFVLALEAGALRRFRELLSHELKYQLGRKMGAQ